MKKAGVYSLFLIGFLAASALQVKAQSKTVEVVKVLSQQDSNKIKQLFFSALRERTVGNIKQAADLFGQITTIQPNHAPSLYELARIELQQGQYNNAGTYIKKAIQSNKDNEWYWMLLADVYKKSNKVDSLVEVFQQLVRINPEKDDYYYDQANALFLTGHNDAAQKVYATIEQKFGPSDDLVIARQRVLLKQGNGKQAAETIEQLIAANPTELKNYFVLSELYLNKGDKNKALQVLQSANAIAPDNYMLKLSMADIYRDQGNKPLAYAALKQAFAAPAMNIDQKVKIILSFFREFSDPSSLTQADELAEITARTHPNEAKALAIYGDVLYQERKFKEAKKIYKDALKLSGDVYLIWEQLLRIETSTGEYDEALKDGDAALSIYPNQAMLYYYVAFANYKQKQYEKAITNFNNALSLDPDNKDFKVQVQAMIGDCYISLKRFKEADKAFEEAIKLDPDNGFVLNNYAYYLSLRGEGLSRAEELSKKAVLLMPSSPSFLDTYAWILFKQKRYKEALTWMEKAVAIDKGNNAVYAEHYGDILYHLGDKEKALEQWKKSKQIGDASETLNRKINEKKYFE